MMLHCLISLYTLHISESRIHIMPTPEGFPLSFEGGKVLTFILYVAAEFYSEGVGVYNDSEMLGQKEPYQAICYFLLFFFCLHIFVF